MKASALARLEGYIRAPLTAALPPALVVKLYSSQRVRFLKWFTNERPAQCIPPAHLSRTVWGLKFRAPLFNASGMFKNGDGYELSYLQGAGSYLAGTTSALPRSGNAKNGIHTPFAPYPRSHSASNWLGLPNDGDQAVSDRLRKLPRYAGFPIGISVAAAPELDERERLSRLIDSLSRYASCGVDFIELNESCPNTAQPEDETALRLRLEALATKFLERRSSSKRPPVIVKFSSDTALDTVPWLLKLLIELGFDGVNFGNSSTDYSGLESFIVSQEQKLFRFFSSSFGGGVSGRPLRQKSRQLIVEASKVLTSLSPKHEFHLIRTGGIENWPDVQDSLSSGASLAQWYTGYFENFSKYGHALYNNFFTGRTTPG